MTITAHNSLCSTRAYHLHIDLARMPLLGNVAWKTKNYTHTQDLSMEMHSYERGRVSTYPCRSLSGSIQENGVDGVVLVVIQITDDPSAERTAPPHSTHIRLGDVSHALIQQGGGRG